MAIGAGKAVLDVRSRRIFPFLQIFREAIGSMAARADCRDFLLLVPVVERLGAPVEVPLLKFEFDARFGLFVRPARPTPEHRCHCYDNRKWREFAAMKDCTHGFLGPGWIVEDRLL